MKINLDKTLVISGGVALAFLIGVIFWWNNKNTIDILGQSPSPTVMEKKSVITGQVCENRDRRLLTVMMASDPEARPLSGLGAADMVFEMPVTPDGITRMMAVFQCEQPSVVGSVRSARQDFIPLASGLKSIYAHWGGEHDALDDLNRHVINNIDALPNPFSAFYRKSGIYAPHNGFTNYQSLISVAEKLGYDLSNQFEGYPHEDKPASRNLADLVSVVDIDYPVPNNVRWTYNESDNTYLRTRSGRPELDKNINGPASPAGRQVSVGVIIVMHTKSKHLRGQYISVDVQGSGLAEIYQNGIVKRGRWSKGLNLSDKLYFYDAGGAEIEFAPGKIWIEIVTQ